MLQALVKNFKENDRIVAYLFCGKLVGKINE